MWGVSMYQEDIEKRGRPQMNTAKLGWEIFKSSHILTHTRLVWHSFLAAFAAIKPYHVTN